MPDSDADELRAKVKENAHESKCGELLEKAAWVLLSRAMGTPEFVHAEQITSSGRVDLLVIAEDVDTTGDNIRQLFIWELKAPRCYQFQVENNNRACPTSHLYSAENQLLHYHDEVQGNETLRSRWNIRRENVNFGGIIIGRHDTFVKHTSSFDPNEAKSLAKQAYRIRKGRFYGPNRIALWTWDRVINLLDKLSVSNHKFPAAPTAEIDIASGAALSLSPRDSMAQSNSGRLHLYDEHGNVVKERKF